MNAVPLKSILIPIIKSVDMVNFLLRDHHRRTAIAAWQIGTEAGFTPSMLKETVLAASIHDIGALYIKERDKLIEIDVDHPEQHCIMGYEMLRTFQPFQRAAFLIKYHHSKYLSGKHVQTQVPIESFCIHLADRIDILLSGGGFILTQKTKVTDYLLSNRGEIFHPELVDAFLRVSKHDRFWLNIETYDIDRLLNEVLNEDDVLLDTDGFEQFSYTLSRIVDFRNHFTSTHSFGVGTLAFEIARLAGMSLEDTRRIKIAGFLHDIGKLAIDNALIDKPGKLDETEYAMIKTHAYYTDVILGGLVGFADIVRWAKFHHEKADGSGYPNGIGGASLDKGSKIVAYADILTALAEDRPYRPGFEPQKVLSIVKEQYVNNIDPELFAIIEANFERLYGIVKKAQRTASKEYADAMIHYHSKAI